MDCLGEKVLIITPQCPGCEQIKQRFEKMGLAHTVKVIDASTPDGFKLCQDLGIMAVPDCVLVEGTGESMRARRCTDPEFVDFLEGKISE